MPKRPRIKGKGADIFLGEEEAVLTAKQQAVKTAKQQAVKTPSQQGLEKATFYLPPGLVDDLDEAKASLRRRYRSRKISKSEIVRIALEQALDDWRERGQDSLLANQLASKE